MITRGILFPAFLNEMTVMFCADISRIQFNMLGEYQKWHLAFAQCRQTL